VILCGVIHMLTQVEPGPTGLVTMHANLIDVTGDRGLGLHLPRGRYWPPVPTPPSRWMAK